MIMKIFATAFYFKLYYFLNLLKKLLDEVTSGINQLPSLILGCIIIIRKEHETKVKGNNYLYICKTFFKLN